MNIAHKVVLITGANRGTGLAPLAAAARVTPIRLDVTNAAQIRQVAARGIFDGLEKGEEDIFPDPAPQSIAEGWRNRAAKALERQFSAFVPQRSLGSAT